MRVFFTSLCLDLPVALFSLQANTRSWSEWLYCGEGGRRRCCATRRSVEYCVVCAVWRSMRVGYEVLVCLCAVCERVRLVRRWGCAPCVHSGVRSFAHLAHRSLYHIGIPGCALALVLVFSSFTPCGVNQSCIRKSSRRHCDDRRHKAATTFKPPPTAHEVHDAAAHAQDADAPTRWTRQERCITVRKPGQLHRPGSAMTPEELNSIRADCMADDIDAPWPDAQNWTQVRSSRETYALPSAMTACPLAGRLMPFDSLKVVGLLYQKRGRCVMFPSCSQSASSSEMKWLPC